MSFVSADPGDTFETWRLAARRLISGNVSPGDVIWNAGPQDGLFGDEIDEQSGRVNVRTPAAFIELAKAVACFDGPERWDVLYRLLFRLQNENRQLLEIETDRDVHIARQMEKAVNRDVHKFHAFVRFRTVEIDNDELYVAWHEPQHFTVERATPFFARRFGSMRFSILTPKGCAHWDRESLVFSAPADRSQAPEVDDTEDYWLLYYRSIFNPFRLKVNAMKKELPVRHWRTLPEAVLIPELIAEARRCSHLQAFGEHDEISNR
jgi:probable DNA metabolism protein